MGAEYAARGHFQVAGASDTPIGKKFEVPSNRVGVVVIGRNEGQRLVRCLNSVRAQSGAVIYIDSGSTDGSVERARELGAKVIELDRTIPFSASRARNAGFAALREMGQFDCVQFADGDCEILDGWVDAGSRFLLENQQFVAVCGKLGERHAGASIYNGICDVEWSVKSGEAEACGGVAMYRVSALEAVGTLVPSERFEDVRRHVDPGWIAEALEATGSATVRRRRLLRRTAAAVSNARHVWFAEPSNPLPVAMLPCLTLLTRVENITVFTASSAVKSCAVSAGP